VKPAGHRTGQKLRRNLHRPMTREQGRALEIIGHAADYLADCYLQEGAEEEIIDFSGPSAEAIQILISSRREILRSLPLTEPLMLRLWNMLLRRKPKFESASMIPFSSSRWGTFPWDMKGYSRAMKLSINGQDREFSELDSGPVLARLIDLLQMKADRIAIERNGEIVPRSTWQSVSLKDGDRLEVVQFVGGGS
jgi:sulfur carrier protein